MIQLVLLDIYGIKITPGNIDYLQSRSTIFFMLSDDIIHSKRSRLAYLRSITLLLLCTFVLRSACPVITIYSSYILR